jgi:fido (protein-threonine AMPylation protein)
MKTVKIGPFKNFPLLGRYFTIVYVADIRQCLYYRYLCGESRKRESNINMPAVNELMSITFAQRQNDIKENPLHVSQLLEKYPFLKLKNKAVVRILLSVYYNAVWFIHPFYHNIS